MLSVVIPTYRRTMELCRCLDALMSQMDKEDEIVVVAEPNDKKTQEAIRERSQMDSRLRILCSDRSGPARAYSLGFASCKGNLIGLLDDDSIPPLDWVARVKETLSSREVGAVGGPVVRSLHERKPLVFPYQVEKLYWFGAVIGNESCTLSSNEVLEVDHLRGANMAFRRHKRPLLLPHLRGDAFRFELDICLSLKEDGYRVVFDPTLKVIHAQANRTTGFERRMTSQSCHDRAYNNTLVLLIHANGFRRAVRFLYSLFIGDGAVPGIAVWAILLIGGNRQVFQGISASIQGRFDALEALKSSKHQFPFPV